MNSLTFAKAVADDTRQQIMSLLCCQWLCVTDVVDKLGNVSQPTVSRHLKVLRERSLVTTERDGATVYYSLHDARVVKALDLLRAVLADNLTQQAQLAQAIS